MISWKNSHEICRSLEGGALGCKAELAGHEIDNGDNCLEVNVCMFIFAPGGCVWRPESLQYPLIQGLSLNPEFIVLHRCGGLGDFHGTRVMIIGKQEGGLVQYN